MLGQTLAYYGVRTLQTSNVIIKQAPVKKETVTVKLKIKQLSGSFENF
jgi:hypothetical protein